MNVDYEPAPPDFLTPEMTSRAMLGELKAIGRKIAAKAKASSPVDPRHDDVHYRDSIKVGGIRRESGGGGPRIVTFVYSDSEYAGPIEDKYHVLENAAG